ncbi:MAG: oleate hydratase [Acidobacteria bacterium]|nr:oleate hydratase [Acidobacteriota bacterium]MBI3426050.1 oleate hydratase [Acidobacteriota bacterium]
MTQHDLSETLPSASPLRHPLVIIGGGFAGLAAAVDLAEQGRHVLVLERRGFLGGRAYSFTDKTTGAVIDNGQHLMMGCYHHTLNFLGKIGALDKLKFQPNPRVDFLHEQAGHASFQCPNLPAPLHLLAGLARLQSIGWNDRLRALRVGVALQLMNGDRQKLADVTVREWLNELGQSEQMQRRFWDIVALATLNETPERASADMFARVLEQAFLHTKRDSTMVISRVGLSELYTTDAQAFIQARGGAVRLNAEVERIEFNGPRVTGLTLRGGEQLAAETVINAAPYFALRRMIAPDVLAASPSLCQLPELKSAPIVSINLWYDRQVTELEFAGLLDSPVEWVFNKNAIAGEPVREWQHLALVISGAHEAAKQTKEELIALAVREMERFFPAARQTKPLHAFVVREHDATLSHTVGVARLRPPQQTEFENFYLAGDWTDTGLPATIESAVWSGQECARRILNRADC